MGLLTDIFVSSPADALQYEARLSAGSLGDLYEVVQYKRLTNLEFGTLRAIIEGQEFDFDKHDLEVLGQPGETWLFRFPEPYVELLAGLKPSAIPNIAEAWAGTEELQWEPSDAQEVIDQLVRLARLARSSSKGLFFWGSL